MEELPINKCLECYEIVLAGWVREIFVEENGDKQGLTAKIGYRLKSMKLSVIGEKRICCC